MPSKDPKREKSDVYSMYVIREIDKGRDFADIIKEEPTPEQLKEARDYIKENIATGNLYNGFDDMLDKATQNIKNANIKFASDQYEKPNTEEIDKFVQIQSDMYNFVHDSGIRSSLVNTAKTMLSLNTHDFHAVYSDIAKREKMWADAFKRDYMESREEISSEYQAGGFNGSAALRKASTFGTAYAFKLLKNRSYDVSKGFDPEFAENCGKEYLDFMRENALFKDVKGNRTPIDDKEKFEERVRKHGKFYRDWAEYIATSFSFEDYTDSAKIEENKAKLDLLSSMLIENSQNCEFIKKDSRTQDLFFESFGGKEYHDKLTSVLGQAQAVTVATDIVNNPSRSPVDRAVYKLYLEIAKKEGGSLEGKSILDLNPEVYCMERSGLFASMATSVIKDLKTDELEKIVETGVVPEGMEEQIKEVWNMTKTLVPPDAEKNREEISKLLGDPVRKKAFGDLSTGLEGTSQGVKLSDGLRNTLLKEGSESVEIYRGAYAEYIKEHPDKEIKGFDYRNVAEFMDLLADESWSKEEKQSFADDFCKQFCESPESRAKLLDKVFDKVDSFSSLNYDLSCLTPGKDLGKQGPDGLTPSERDFFKLQKLVHAEQALRTSQYVLNDYFDNRYSDFESHAKMTNKLNNITAYSNPLSTIFHTNGVDFLSKTERPPAEMETGDRLDEFLTQMGNISCDARAKILEGQDPKKFDSVLRIDIPEGENPSKKDYIKTNLVGNVMLSPGMTDIGTTVKDTMGWSATEYVYIDGMPAKDYIQPFLEKGERVSEATVNEYIRSGEHKIDLVQLALDKNGDVVPYVQTLALMDNKDDPVPEDPGRAERVAKVRENMNARLGLNKNYMKFATPKSMSISQELYEKLGKEKPSLQKDETVAEMGQRLGKELKGIDRWYHRNSTEFNNVMKALKTPENEKAVIEACDAYINKYTAETGTFKRSTDLGNDRMKKITEIKGLFRSAESYEKVQADREKKARSAKFSNQKAEKSDIKKIEKEYNKSIGKEEKVIAKTEIVKTSPEKTKGDLTMSN